MKSLDEHEEEAVASQSETQPQPRSRWRSVGRVCLWTALSPVLLCVLIIMLVYIPPIQKVLVDYAAEQLTDVMGMEVSVGRVRLTPMLDLTLGDVTAIQANDTVLDASELNVSLRLLPLFGGQVEADCVRLTDTYLDTRTLIDACTVSGHVGTLYLDSHTTDLTTSLAVVSKARLEDSDLRVVLADSVPEDTTESEPATWRIDVRDVSLHNVGVTLQLPGDGGQFTNISAYIGDAAANGYLDLGAGTYDIQHFELRRTDVRYADVVALRDSELDVDSLIYKATGDLSLDINRFVSRVSLPSDTLHAFNVSSLDAHVDMDSVSLSVPRLRLLTDDSSLDLTARMDLNAFDEVAPGRYTLKGRAHIGKGDLLKAIDLVGGDDVKDVRQTVARYMNPKPVFLTMDVQGSGETLLVQQFTADVEDCLRLEAEGRMKGEDIALTVTANTMGATLAIDGSYNTRSDAYKLALDIDNLYMTEVQMDDPLRALLTTPVASRPAGRPFIAASGTINAEGHGFDFYSPHTQLDLTADMPMLRYDSIDVSTSHLAAQLVGGVADIQYDCHNDNLNALLSYSGAIARHSLGGTLDMAIDHADMNALGLYSERLTVGMDGTARFSYDLAHKFDINTTVGNFDIRLNGKKLPIPDFALNAVSLDDSTSLKVNSGDLNVDFSAPYNLWRFIAHLGKLGDHAERMKEERTMDFEAFRSLLPNATLHASAGTDNPLSVLLGVNEMSFSRLTANVDVIRGTGMTGAGHIYDFNIGGTILDTCFFSVHPDSACMDYRVGVMCRKRDVLPAFRASIEGQFSVDSSDSHLSFSTPREGVGLDIGVRALRTDTAMNLKLYPENPIIGFRRFRLNADNYISISKRRPLHAMVELTSEQDSCHLAFLAYENEYGQMFDAMIEKLDIGDFISIMPFVPVMDGLLSVNAKYKTDEGGNTRVIGEAGIRNFTYETQSVGNIHSYFRYIPDGRDMHKVDAMLGLNGANIAILRGMYDTSDDGTLDANLAISDFPLSIANPFIPGQMAALDGSLGGDISVKGPVDKLLFNGGLITNSVHVTSPMYSFNLRVENDTIPVKDSRVSFDNMRIYSVEDKPLTLRGYVDFADPTNLWTSMTVYGRNFKLIDSKRTAKSVIFGNMYGDFFARINGPLSDLSIRGNVNVLGKTDMTYIMTETPLSQGDRLDDIVTFVDFKHPEDSVEVEQAGSSISGLNLNLSLTIEDGARFNCEFSSDRQSYVNVQGGGTLQLKCTPEGEMTLQGRYTVGEGEMKYTLPVIPLKTFRLHNGSYIDFTGDATNPILNIAATERTKTTVGMGDGTSRAVAFDVGLKIGGTLNNMILEFTIEAPEDLTVQNELASCSPEDKNMLAVALLATGMYMSVNNTSNVSANNALNAFLENEINNITGKALASAVNVNLGVEQSTLGDGRSHTDYSFQFSKRFFSDRLNVVLGGKVSADNNTVNNRDGAYIDNISLEWRLDNGGSRYVRLFHEKDYTNLIEGELDKNGAGIVLRKTVNKIGELFHFGNSRNQQMPQRPVQRPAVRPDATEAGTERKEESK